jgi:hypothetical protein
MKYNDGPSDKSFPVLGTDIALGEFSTKHEWGSKSIPNFRIVCRMTYNNTKSRLSDKFFVCRFENLASRVSIELAGGY